MIVLATQFDGGESGLKRLQARELETELDIAELEEGKKKRGKEKEFSTIEKRGQRGEKTKRRTHLR